MKNKDKPDAGKTYALTGPRGSKCIANGNSWKESEVPSGCSITLVWGKGYDVEKRYDFDTVQQKEAFIKGVEEAVGWMDYRVKGDL